MRSDGRVPVAIVGGGYSGTIIAAQLARRGIGSVLIDGSGRMGRGVAYSTAEPAHLLNVCADGMSAWADDPDHFARRFGSEGGVATGFAQRRLFGRYLGEILDEAIVSGNVDIVHQPATRAVRSDGAWRIELGQGEPINADALILAVGNQEPEPLSPFTGIGDRFIRDPWGAASRAAVAELAATGGTALLVGTGLTMIDLVLSLDAAGYPGRIVALSRRGLIPRSHADFNLVPVERQELPFGNLRALWRWLRKRGAEVGWRAAIDSLRPHSHALWQSLDGGQQRRFLRHARPWWDVHRHRIAPEVAQLLARMIGDGRLEIVAGRIIGAQDNEAGLTVEYRRRGSGQGQAATFTYGFNCTGPLHSIARTRDPLLRSLLDAGLIHADHLGIGLDVDDASRAGARLWALGPLTKGRYWEIIAVPDIRDQAAAVAGDIAKELGR
ncbi:MAG TPA: FAD/NAD(P)-binding protein [Stellaceae bacterium]|nr:FAD/NAD(P)-binding protein [Stellaceae bacterium]